MDTRLIELIKSEHPGRTLLSWHEAGSLQQWLPEVSALFGVPQNPQHHPEVDTGVHISMCLEVGKRIQASDAAIFAVLMHDLGKALTPQEEWPKHIDHESRGAEPVLAVCKRLAVPDYWTKLAHLVCVQHLNGHRALVMRSRSVIDFLESTGMVADPHLEADFRQACEADMRGRLGKTEKVYVQGQFLAEAAKALRKLPWTFPDGIRCRESQDLHAARLHAVRQVRERVKEPADAPAC